MRTLTNMKPPPCPPCLCESLFFRKTQWLLIICGIVSAWWLLIGCHSISSIREPEEEFSQEEILAQVPSTVTIEDDLEAQQHIMRAFAKAYPDKISAVEFLDNDWIMMVNGIRFYYAHGRFLPEELREQWEEYQPYDFYTYPWIGTDRQKRIAYKYPVYSVGSSFLFDTLYASPSEDDSWDWQEKYSFLGVKMLIHQHIKPLLDRITAGIRIAAQDDQSVNEWIAELQTSPPGGWNWRVIANTKRRSNHSYGTAIDLLPRDLKGRKTYWQWNSGGTMEIDTYYMPPETVIKIFEEHGFVWGGKWDLIDTMHFEYRPEILLLNNFSVRHLERGF